ncbi:MAG: hypothetical protein UZ10_BCD003002000 [Bacteroidetes bacterium OLB10]|nr:MAG: hypothetical protein UZ10_BCD003002000 [Bacteroidetes bacterium OLB10]MCC7515356.1 hypothetical protein [Bacteroidia bacterium]
MNFDNFTSALVIIAPTLIVAGGMYLLIKNLLERDYRLKLLESRRLLQKEMLPLKLQAIERMVVFLERLRPESMVFRILQPGMQVRDLQLDLLATIRSEYEHNLSQQVYLTPQSWVAVRQAKDEMIALINVSADSVQTDAKAMELSQKIFQNAGSQVASIDKAIASLRGEVAQILV